MAKKLKAIGGDGSGGEPPVETRWKPGCKSPNPAGRPRTKGISEMAREYLEEIDPKSGTSRILVHFKAWDRMARQGSSKHSELLFAYAYGRPAQTVNTNLTVLSAEEHNANIERLIAVAETLPKATDDRPSDKRVN